MPCFGRFFSYLRLLNGKRRRSGLAELIQHAYSMVKARKKERVISCVLSSETLKNFQLIEHLTEGEESLILLDHFLDYESEQVKLTDNEGVFKGSIKVRIFKGKPKNPLNHLLSATKSLNIGRNRRSMLRFLHSWVCLFKWFLIKSKILVLEPHQALSLFLHSIWLNTHKYKIN